MHLLDVNVLIALCDADHQYHALARSWFRAHSPRGWATCPLTENGLLRVMGQTAYPGGPGSPDGVRPLLLHLRSLPGHQFWEDTVSLTDQRFVPSLRGVTSRQLTDIYLLALAVRRRGRLVTLDARIDPSPVTRGTAALFVIGEAHR